jgi:dTDP-4-dehydro-6-deoxy-alpha-D-glucopyranose 2,3-dehydratase
MDKKFQNRIQPVMMHINETAISFLHSALQPSGSAITNEGLLDWINQRRDAVKVEVEHIPFSQLKQWHFDAVTGNLQHASGKFFSIEGIEIKTNWGNVAAWTQPIINQPEIGFLGIITRKINGVLHFLMQAKIEPGNINYVQLSPTLQATKSNYSKVHKGKAPLYLEYFNGEKKVKVLLDQLQSEQGARFMKKRNRNIIIEVQEDIPVYEDFCWLTLGQLKMLMCQDNLINMDTRTVLSGISYGTYDINGIDLLYRLLYYNKKVSGQQEEILFSALSDSNTHHSFDEIISWITSLKSKYELEVNRVPLKNVQKWVRTENAIHHEQHKYFSVIAADVHIGNREVVSWSQPLVESAQEGLIAFIIKKINGVFHFLVQAKIEAGNFDILELAPTVQCLTGNYRQGENEYEVPFINEVLNAPADKVIFKTMQSEEGGRFYREQNLNIIIEAGEDFPVEVPESYCWITLNQLYTFIRFNNYLNIQARSLLAAVKF